MFVKPAPAPAHLGVDQLIVRCPVTKQPIPATGKEVPDGDPYWNRRLRSGDVVLAQPPVAEAAGGVVLNDQMSDCKE